MLYVHYCIHFECSFLCGRGGSYRNISSKFTIISKILQVAVINLLHPKTIIYIYINIIHVSRFIRIHLYNMYTSSSSFCALPCTHAVNKIFFEYFDTRAQGLYNYKIKHNRISSSPSECYTQHFLRLGRFFPFVLRSTNLYYFYIIRTYSTVFFSLFNNYSLYAITNSNWLCDFVQNFFS